MGHCGFAWVWVSAMCTLCVEEYGWCGVDVWQLWGGNECVWCVHVHMWGFCACKSVKCA